MGLVRILADDVVSLIAAGEVVERPCSVVKELIENALDAGASRVSIRTAGAGMKLIDVEDDGCGMDRGDVELAPRSYATSKISAPEDLFRIRTYGFRGEALSSISAVSRFELVSSDVATGEGWRVAIEGQNVVESAPAPHERGTTVRIRNLFFNTPARKKFLKSEATERRRILETVLSFGLAFPQLELHYADDDRPVLDLVPVASWRDRMAAVLGSGTMTHMVEVSAAAPGPAIRGYVSLPTHTRADRNHIFIYVNRRLVREKTVQQALHEAFRSVIPPRRFPVAVLALEVPLDQVDVNVHPNKLEVRLGSPSRVFEAVRGSIQRAISGRAEPSREVSYASVLRTADAAASPATPSEGSAAEGGALARPEAAGGAVDAYRSRIKEAYGSYMKASAQSRDLGPQLALQAPSRDREESSVVAAGERVQTDESLFWQFNNSFIFIQVRGGIVVIDQHAAHERIIYDSSQKQLQNDVPVSQQILFPIHLELSIAELEVFRSSRDVFHRLGFHLEPFGGKSILVRGYPHGLKNWDEGKLLLQIFDDIVQDRVPGRSHMDRIVASFACRSAVKAGQRLGLDEMKMLADQLFATANPYSCPHGRPTIQRLSLDEIESWFLRR